MTRPSVPARLALPLALLAGVAQALAMASPLDAQPLPLLQVLSLAVLVGLVQRAPGWAQALWAGWVFATAWLCTTCWWLFVSMHTYGGLAAPLAVLAVLALAAFLGGYYALVCGAFRALALANPAWGAIFFGALWLLAELARGQWLTGFPWGAGGYAHGAGLLAPWVPWLGVYGTGLVASVVAACLVLAWLQRPAGRSARLAALGLALGLGTVPALLPAGWTVPTPPMAVALLQGNIPQDEKFQSGSGVPLALRWYAEQLRDSTATLVVAPETAVPMLPQQLPAGYWEALQARFAAGRQAALVGVPLGSSKDGYTNSVVGMAPGAPLYQYDKHHLVPFGEFIPPLFRWFTELMNIPLGDFNRGAVGQASMAWQGQRLAPNICYEDLFGEELAARFADPAQAPTVFVNVSNIGWFGNTVAIDQHLQISRLRALEFERPMIRATNTGPTVVINHRGEVTHSLPRHTRGVLTGEVQGRTGMTPFAWWSSRYGLWPLWLGAGLVVLAAWAASGWRRR